MYSFQSALFTSENAFLNDTVDPSQIFHLFPSSSPVIDTANNEQQPCIHPLQIFSPSSHDTSFPSTIVDKRLSLEESPCGYEKAKPDENLSPIPDSLSEQEFSAGDQHDSDNDSEWGVATTRKCRESANSVLKRNRGSKPLDIRNVCHHCQETNTTLWRRSPEGHTLCNACGLFFKLHGVIRPLSLKSSVIKRRNRSGNNRTRKRRLKKRNHQCV